MKQIFYITALLLLFSCKKSKDLSQEDRERSEPIASNQIIENEHGGIRFFILNGSAQLKSTVPVFTTTPFENYFIEADKIPQNSTIELWFSSTGTFDLNVEGFTAPPNSIGKRWNVKGLSGSSRIKLHKGIVRYSFNLL